MNQPSETPSTSECPRRSFFARLSMSLSALLGAAMTLPGIGFVLGPVVRKPDQRWRAVGEVNSFKVGETVLVSFEDAAQVPWAGVTTKTGAWLRRVSESDFIAFSINCRHLGCPVRWVAESSLFMCPCHGGVYYADGTVAAGPPPEPLHRYHVRVQGDQVQIQTGPIPLTRFLLSVDMDES